MPGACRWSLDTTFKMAARKDNDDNNNSSNSIVIERYSDSDPPPCPCRQLWPPEGTSTFIHGDLMLDSPTGLQKLTPSVTRSQEAGQSHNATDISIGHARTLELCGLYQTYRYADSLSPQLRSLLTFKPEVRREVNSFFGESRPVDWTHGSFIRVGFHIRRGDFVRHDWRDVGLTVVDEGFVNRVVDYFISRYRRVQFVIATDDKHWATSVFRSKMSNSSVAIVKSPTGDILEPRTFGKDVDKNNSLDRTSVVVKPEVSAVLSEGRSAAVDLALVSSCDAVVISTGSFGWWAAWLANRPITIYYSLWPRPNSPLSKYFRAKEYFPQRWIPMQ